MTPSQSQAATLPQQLIFSFLSSHPEPQQGPVQPKVIDVERKQRRRGGGGRGGDVSSTAVCLNPPMELPRKQITMSAAHGNNSNLILHLLRSYLWRYHASCCLAEFASPGIIQTHKKCERRLTDASWHCCFHEKPPRHNNQVPIMWSHHFIRSLSHAKYNTLTPQIPPKCIVDENLACSCTSHI